METGYSNYMLDKTDKSAYTYNIIIYWYLIIPVAIVVAYLAVRWYNICQQNHETMLRKQEQEKLKKIKEKAREKAREKAKNMGIKKSVPEMNQSIENNLAYIEKSRNTQNAIDKRIEEIDKQIKQLKEKLGNNINHPDLAADYKHTDQKFTIWSI